MLTFDEIYALAVAHHAEKFRQHRFEKSAAIETKAGWYFTLVSDTRRLGGCRGFVVNKQSGRILDLGSSVYTREQEIAFYDAGYQFARGFFVVHRVVDLEASCTAIEDLNFKRIEYEYEAGDVWTRSIPLSKVEIEERLGRLPAVFGPFAISFERHRLEAIRTSDVLEFELIEAKPTQH